jgi:hypothetical protein
VTGAYISGSLGIDGHHLCGLVVRVPGYSSRGLGFVNTVKNFQFLLFSLEVFCSSESVKYYSGRHFKT